MLANIVGHSREECSCDRVDQALADLIGTAGEAQDRCGAGTNQRRYDGWFGAAKDHSSQTADEREGGEMQHLGHRIAIVRRPRQSQSTPKPDDVAPGQRCAGQAANSHPRAQRWNSKAEQEPPGNDEDLSQLGDNPYHLSRHRTLRGKGD